MPSSTVSPNPGIAGGDRRQEGEREASDVLSPDLWVEILVRLPVLSLLSLKSVSKTFLSLIKDPKFVHLHLSRFNGVYSESTHSDLLLLERSSDDWKFLLVCGSNTPKETGPKFPIGGVVGGDNLDVIGYVNGLLWLHSFSYDFGGRTWSYPSIRSCEMILCNPSMGKFEVIPLPRSSDLGPPSFGFGYDPVTDDYKAVSIVHAELECDILTTPWPNNGRVTFAEVYSLREASWKELRGYGIFSDWLLCDWCLKHCVYVNGALHWMAKRAADRDVSRVISFDLVAESFSYKELPNFDTGDGRVKFLVLFRGLLAVLCITAVDISVWVMRENDWAIECTIGSVSSLYNFLFQVRDGISSTVLCEESNVLIIAGCHGVSMLSYNIETHEVKPYYPGVTYVGKYVNSLVWRDSLLPLDPPRRS